MPEAVPKHWTTLEPADPAAVVELTEVQQGLEVREQALGEWPLVFAKPIAVQLDLEPAGSDLEEAGGF